MRLRNPVPLIRGEIHGRRPPTYDAVVSVAAWYYSAGTQPSGPVDEAAIADLFAKGTIKRSTLVWKQGMAAWIPLERAPEFSALVPPAAAAAPRPATPVAAAPTAAASAPVVRSAPASQEVVRTGQKSELVAKASEVLGEGLCPTCGLYVGAGFTCIRCGARVKKAISIRLIKTISVIGSIVGIVVLWMAAAAKEPAPVKVGAIDEMMSGALVEVDGRIVAFYQDEMKNSLSFTVNDGTGRIKVGVFNKLKRFREHFGEGMPRLGDHVRLVGSVSASEEFGISLFLALPERLEVVERARPRAVALKDLDERMIGDLVKIRAQVQSHKVMRKGESVRHEIVFHDGTGGIPMVIWGTDWDLFPAQTRSLLETPGSQVEMTILVSQFRDNLQAQMVDPKGVRPAGAAPAPVPVAPAAAAPTAPPTAPAPAAP